MSPLVSNATVSVVIPCLNEERFIGAALANLADQYNPHLYEIIIVDGISEDATRDVVDNFRAQRPDILVTVIDNPARAIPVALNLGIKAARGEIITRLDAHAVASPGYVRRCVAVLQQQPEVGVVGMPCQVCAGGDTLTAKAIAVAVSHPFGIGDAKYRLGRGSAQQESVDTVAFSSFRKKLWEELGGFQESLIANEDYEFNYRVRLSGKTVLLDKAEHCDYFARSTLKGLCAQYWRYGNWKARMVLQHPTSIKLRQIVAPVFLLSILVLLLAGVWLHAAWWLLAVEIAAYVLTGLFFAAKVARKSGRVGLIALLPVVFGLIHLTWGSGFLLGLVRPPRQ